MRRITLRLLVTYCGKSRCHRCCDGRGHGPYWYADWYENRAYKRSYIGKNLPLFLLVMSEQKSATTRVAWAEDPERLLNAVQPEREPLKKTTYRQQVSFCGQSRCRKCREGIGHGPYWYAYQTINGRTRRTYIGKELPGHIQQQLYEDSNAMTIEMIEANESSPVQ